MTDCPREGLRRYAQCDIAFEGIGFVEREDQALNLQRPLLMISPMRATGSPFPQW